MSKVPSNYSQQPWKSPIASSEQSAPNKPSRPGWLEIIVGLVVLAIVGFGVGSLLRRLGFDPVVYGLILTSWTGVATLTAFAVAVRLRIRSLNAFGVRPVSKRWLLIAIGVGLVAFVLKGLAVLGWIQITGNTKNVQGVYAEGGSAGVLSLVLATLFLGIVTPLGEELFFRGVVAKALLRYGSFIGVVGSTVNLCPLSWHQHRLSRSRSRGSRHCRGLPPQRLGLDCCHCSRRFQLAHNSGDGSCWHGLIGRIIWRLNQWQF